MIPDFPKIKSKLKKSLLELADNLIKSDPFLRMIKTQRHFEGNRMFIKTVDGEENESGYKDVLSKFEIKAEEIIEYGPDLVINKFKNMAHF